MNDDGENSEFQLQIPTLTGEQLPVRLKAGEVLFCVGVNGSGKSSLLQLLHQNHRSRAVRILAHRQTWLGTSKVTLTANAREQQGIQLQDWWSNPQARWNGGPYFEQQPARVVFDLVNKVNQRAREITDQVDVGNVSFARELSTARPSPVSQINDLLGAANLPVRVTIEQGDEIKSSRHDGAPYSMAEMSDGERNAVLIGAEVLTANTESLFLIDEPERHLHRSIILPLIVGLLRTRPDCAFVVATHEIGLPLEFPESQTVVLREVEVASQKWDAHLLDPGHTLDEDVRQAVLGGRRAIVFVEGTDNSSLDLPLYQRMFPDATIVPMGSRRQVIQAVKGLRSARDLAWINAFGIVDLDFDDPEDAAKLEEGGVFPLPWVAVESIYYHPEIQRRVAERKAHALGGEISAMLASAAEAVISEMRIQANHVARRFAVEVARKRAYSLIPVGDDVKERIEVNIDVEELRVEIQAGLNGAIEGQDVGRLIERYSVKNTGIPRRVARALRFTNQRDYEEAVIKLFESDAGAVQWLKVRLDRLWTAVSKSADN